MRLRAISHAMHERVRRFAPPGMGMQHMLTMKTLAVEGPVSQSRLADVLGISKGAVSTTVAGLEAAGFVTRTRSPDDARIVIVAATDKAASIKDRIEEPVTDMFRDLFEDWTDRDAQRTLRLLDGLIERARTDDA